MSDRDEIGPQRPRGGSRLFAPPIAALQFLTIFPPIIRRLFTSREMGRAVSYFPVIGTLLGGALYALDWLLARVLPAEVGTALALAAWVCSTGALHLGDRRSDRLCGAT